MYEGDRRRSDEYHGHVTIHCTKHVHVQTFFSSRLSPYIIALLFTPTLCPVYLWNNNIDNISCS